MMIDAIHDRWMQLPPDRRPKLMLYGESLGSMAGQGAFDWLPDIAPDGFLVGAVGGSAQRQPAVEGDHRPARPGNA